MWVRALEKVIHDKCGYYKPRQQDPVVELKAKACHAENQLTDLIEQVIMPTLPYTQSFVTAFAGCSY